MVWNQSGIRPLFELMMTHFTDAYGSASIKELNYNTHNITGSYHSQIQELSNKRFLSKTVCWIDSTIHMIWICTICLKDPHHTCMTLYNHHIFIPPYVYIIIVYHFIQAALHRTPPITMHMLCAALCCGWYWPISPISFRATSLFGSGQGGVAGLLPVLLSVDSKTR